MVETVPTMTAGSFLLSGLPGLGPKDLTVELARAGLAELYTGGGSEYYVRCCICTCALVRFRSIFLFATVVLLCLFAT
jgi:hypothetical protein